MLSRCVFLLLLVLVSACSSNADKAAPARDVGTSSPTGSATSPATETSAATENSISPTDAWNAIRGGALLVDVRTPAEYDQGHLEGARSIPHDQVAARASELVEYKDRAIVLYCRSGNRSSQAKKALDSLGFTNVMNAGGYESLKRAQ